MTAEPAKPPDARPRRSPLARAWTWCFVFCAANSLWAAVGGWSVTFGGERLDQLGVSQCAHEAGIYSYRGFLVIAVRQSSIMRMGVLRQTSPLPAPVRRPIPWSIGVHFRYSYSESNGILDRRGKPHWPIRAVWDSATSEWHNRGVAIHWTLLVALLALPPLVRTWSAQPRAAGVCHQCGYDLRATPNRCPECGTPAANGLGRG